MRGFQRPGRSPGRFRLRLLNACGVGTAPIAKTEYFAQAVVMTSIDRRAADRIALIAFYLPFLGRGRVAHNDRAARVAVA